ncbi:PucR family transcriptional regulator ligand-binding domain-containing protein [Sinomonas sp. ASV486]|uniref:PucR family transcriptional regulator n=1 Tax=Sinomonas sp. ASV486 TaxID=3051170 RepID=UPI0027DCBBA3|nr:PucR family transcriptional regulator ligand-binding domain-containing protein [Sinomonas sp. ASV486]MDQ4490928.1 PucR family transcriptional regulator ligand-binding domain-containing protein [Sinomonas sp. ASV486]
MSLPLSEILAGGVLSLGAPVVVGGASAVGRARVRWVHSSEVLEIAPLLSGGELLLTGGAALLALKPAAQVEYVWSLASRRVAALAVETAGTGRHLPAELVAAADEAGLPLVELRQVVPFVEVAEAVNRRIVSGQVNALQIADRLSQDLTERIASSGAQLSPLVALIAETLGVFVRVVDTRGSLLAVAGPEPMEGAHGPETELAVGGIGVARLELIGGPAADVELLETVIARVRSIVALALAQQHRPSLARLAEDELLRLIGAGGGGDRLVELCQAAGIGPEQPVVMAVVRRPAEGSADIEQRARQALPSARLIVDGAWVDMLIPLPAPSHHAERELLLGELRQAVSRAGLTGALGPTAATIRQAAFSLAEARVTWRLGRSSKWTDAIHDASDFLVERTAERSLPRGVVDAIVEEALGELIRLDQRNGGELVRTLDVWIASGCNATESAEILFLERQSLHKRLRRIFGAIGGDPRGRGKLGGLAFAAKLVRGNAQLREDLRP